MDSGITPWILGFVLLLILPVTFILLKIANRLVTKWADAILSAIGWKNK